MKKLSILFITVSLLFSSCENMLDINHNPNRLEELEDVSTILAVAQLGLAYNTMSWDVAFGGGYWVQYWTQNYTASQFKDLCRYADTDFNTFYSSLVAGAMKDLQYMIDVASEDESQLGYYFVAEALQIFGWQFLVDLYGNVPYFEALRGDEGINHPEFDDGETIYNDLLDRIDKLLALDLSGAYVDSDADMVFAGNMNRWREFANSLKLKLNMRLTETSGYNNASMVTFIENNDFLSQNASISGSIFEDQDYKRHPLYEYNTGTTFVSTNVIACKSFFDYLSVNGDPRVGKYFNGDQGAFFGDYDSKQDSDGDGTTDNKESFARARLSNSADLILISSWENNFRIAEVYVRAGDYNTARTYYEAGVEASFTQVNATNFVTDDEDANYPEIINTITDAGSYAEWPASGSQNDYLDLIGHQRWVAHYYFQHGESFLERNRTKIPAVSDIDVRADRNYAWYNFPVGDLTLSVVGRDNLNGNLPASLLYPYSVVSRNNNSLPQKPNLGEKVFWDKKSGK
ncbi:MAG: SusD/RagB family nutrient-binding outer membrane lipoprotein [Rikenellaceae bacterium]|nr:SusD/RagB family nutrient-binding outer membrane lipoprotein [Rikenellaceae bacterium]